MFINTALVAHILATQLLLLAGALGILSVLKGYRAIQWVISGGFWTTLFTGIVIAARFQASPQSATVLNEFAFWGALVMAGTAFATFVYAVTTRQAQTVPFIAAAFAFFLSCLAENALAWHLGNRWAINQDVVAFLWLLSLGPIGAIVLGVLFERAVKRRTRSLTKSEE